MKLKSAITLFLIIYLFPAAHAQMRFFDEAEKTYNAGQYYKAVDMYREAYDKIQGRSIKDEITFKIAECYRKTSQPRRAELWYSNAIKRWPLFPKFIQEAFVQAFSPDFINNPNRRNPENEWQKLFLRLRDQTVLCTCGSETFIDPDEQDPKCISCGKKIEKPLTLEVSRNKVVMFPGKNIYNLHTKLSDDFTTITGEVIRNKKNPNLWGIRNLSTDTWICELPSGAQKNINSNEVVPVLKDIKIGFGAGVKGEIV